MQLAHVERPLQRIAMDILGPLPETEQGNKYILVIGDYSTKWKETYPLPKMEAMTVARHLIGEFNLYVVLVYLSSYTPIKEEILNLV